MRTLTLGSVKSVIGRIEGVCRDNARVRDMINEAEQKILNRPDKPVGSLVMMEICVSSSGCLSWPRQVQTIEAFAVCDNPGTIRGEPFHFIGPPNGRGVWRESSCPGNTLIDAGTACTFDTVVSDSDNPRRIAIIAQDASDAGKTVLIRYQNASGQRVYSTIGGVVQEGELLTLVAPPARATTSQNVRTGSPYHIVKQVTNYPIRLYEVDSTGLIPYPITKLIAMYEPSEEIPIYRKSTVPGLCANGTCASSDDDDCSNNRLLTALVKLQHVPVVVDNDPLVIGNLAALKLMVMSIMREEQNRLEESAIFEAKARAEIDGEISSYLGDGMVTSIRVESAASFGAGTVGGWSWWW